MDQSSHGRDGHAPFLRDAKSNFKETLVLGIQWKHLLDVKNSCQTPLTSLCVTHVLGQFVTDLLGSYPQGLQNM